LRAARRFSGGTGRRARATLEDDHRPVLDRAVVRVQPLRERFIVLLAIDLGERAAVEITAGFIPAHAE